MKCCYDIVVPLFMTASRKTSVDSSMKLSPSGLFNDGNDMFIISSVVLMEIEIT